jgi:hypothetical protein|nr:hypothetical protein [Phenylobacterium sp.]
MPRRQLIVLLAVAAAVAAGLFAFFTKLRVEFRVHAVAAASNSRPLFHGKAQVVSEWVFVTGAVLLVVGGGLGVIAWWIYRWFVARSAGR